MEGESFSIGGSDSSLEEAELEEDSVVRMACYTRCYVSGSSPMVSEQFNARMDIAAIALAPMSREKGHLHGILQSVPYLLCCPPALLLFVSSG